jgi:hypothetical protein
LLNGLFYGGKLNATVARYRQGPVITVGYTGSKFWDKREPLRGNYGGDIVGSGHTEMRETYEYRSDDSSRESWQAKEMAALPELLTDDEGRFTNIDGSVAPVVHQFDRFGVPIFGWVAEFGRKRKIDIPIEGTNHRYLKTSDVLVCGKS